MSEANPPGTRAEPAGAADTSFFAALWSDAKLEFPDRFNTWPLVSELSRSAPERLEIGPGLRPRLPIQGTHQLDISEAAVEQLTSHGGIGRVGTITALPYPDAQFDLVGAFDILEHVPDDGLAMTEIGRVLKAGGVLVFAVPLYGARWTAFDDAVGHQRRYEPEALTALITRHRFSVELSGAFGMQPSSHLLTNWGLWWLRNVRRTAMFWYNLLLPLACHFQKPLKLESGMIDTRRVDEVILVCRKCA